MSRPTKPDLSISGQDFITLCQACAADGRTVAGVTVKGTARYLPVVWEKRPRAWLPGIVDNEKIVR